MKDPTRQMLRLRSMYAEQESDCLVFQQKSQSEGGGLELVETPLAVQHMDKVNRSGPSSTVGGDTRYHPPWNDFQSPVTYSTTERMQK